MQMIDVLSRLRELDVGNSNVIYENTHLSEDLKGDMHPDAEKVLKHIKPEYHHIYKPYLKVGTYKGNYGDRADILAAAEKAGHANDDTGVNEGVAEGTAPKPQRYDHESEFKAQIPKEYSDPEESPDGSTGTFYDQNNRVIGMFKRDDYRVVDGPGMGWYSGPKDSQGVAEGAEQSIEECGMMGGMDRPSTPASINMTAATGEELGHMLKDIMSLAGVAKSEPETISTTPSIGLASRDGMDMKSMIDKMNDLETVETIDSMPSDPMPTEPFDAEQHAHHENPPGADRKGNANNPRAYDTNESAVEKLMAEYKKFISEDSK